MSPNRKINFQWDLNGNCNYRCPYCWKNGIWVESKQSTVYVPVADWANLWSNIYNKYGTVDISVSGGEPSLYPNFIHLINELAKQHNVAIVTNLSFDVKSFISKVKSKNIHLSASFHPIFVRLEDFLKKALILKDHGVLDAILYVTYPPQLKQAQYYKTEFQKKGFSFIIQPFWGKYHGRSYPESYSEEEKEAISLLLGNQKQIEYRLDQKMTLGKLCGAGQIHAVIEPSGLVKRCGFSSEAPIGNFLDKNFKLLDTPLPCTSTYCPCNDYVYLVEENKNERQPLHLEKKTKVALVLSPGWGRGSPPYVLALLCGILRQKNYAAYTFDINNELYHRAGEKDKLLWRWEESLFWQKKLSVERFIAENNKHIDRIIVDEILGCGTKIVCFSIYSTTKLMSLELAKRIKAKDPRIYIIFGGTESKRKLDWRSLIEQECVDILVFDEADETLPAVIEVLNKGGDLSACKGIAYKVNKEIIDCGDRPVLENLDYLPFADYSDFNFDLYESTNPAVIPISTSRGCTEHCTYCSTKQVTEGFRTMSGKRIFEEVMYQIKSYKEKAGRNRPVFIFFLDLLINARIEILEDWVNRLAEQRKKDKDLANLKWHAQIILRSQLSSPLIEKIKLSGCDLLNYGVESGSPKVLKDMGKNIKPEEMEKLIKAIYDAGIFARGNFMFGFPTETEDDFRETLGFIERNGKYMQEVYPSRTLCALETFSILDMHKEKFGITIPRAGAENLFWESQNGENNYPARLKRYERFCELVSLLPHKPLVTGIADVKRDNCFCMGEYYRFNKKYQEAIDCYEEYLSLGGTDKTVYENINLCKKEFEKSDNFKANLINHREGKTEEKSINDLSVEENLILNEREYSEKKIVLTSTPPDVYFQIDGPCNQNCIFCSRPREYAYFDLNDYFDTVERKLHPVLSKASNVYLTGAGEFLLLPEAERILHYFNNEFPNTNKIFATNGSTVTPNIANLIIQHKRRYAITISLPASNAELHRKLTNAGNFDKIVENLEYLFGLRNRCGDLKTFFMFLITAINIEDLPNIIRLAARLRPDSVYCEYVSIYKPEQKELSCFFKQDLTNAVFDEAERLAKDLKVHLRLPWRFKQNNYPECDCKEPWKQIMINPKGEILPCCLFGDFKETLMEKDFWEIWNGNVYQEIRKSLIGESTAYCKLCLRRKPSTVNDFNSHVITRGKSEDENKLATDVALISTAKDNDAAIKLPPSHNVFFNWDIHYSCNYRCSYCFFNGKWEEATGGNVYPGLQVWIDIWERLHDKYGGCFIDISGGEPTTYPHFFELINHLSQMHSIRFTTNLSFNHSEFFKKTNSLKQKDKMYVNSSFHPEWSSLPEFYEKLTIIKEAGFKVLVTYVAYPPQLDRMASVKEKFVKSGVDFVIQPFRGKHQGLDYPDSYTQEQRKILEICSTGNPEGLFEHHLGRKKDNEKRLCRMGQLYAKIHPNGEAYRCCAEGVGRLGNIIKDKDFSLFSEAAYCEVSCPCWKAMLVGKESKWLHLWKEGSDTKQ